MPIYGGFKNGRDRFYPDNSSIGKTQGCVKFVPTFPTLPTDRKATKQELAAYITAKTQIGWITTTFDRFHWEQQATSTEQREEQPIQRESRPTVPCGQMVHRSFKSYANGKQKLNAKKAYTLNGITPEWRRNDVG